MCFLAWEILLVLTAGQRSPNYGSKTLQLGLMGDGDNKKKKREREERVRNTAVGMWVS